MILIFSAFDSLRFGLGVFRCALVGDDSPLLSFEHHTVSFDLSAVLAPGDQSATTCV